MLRGGPDEVKVHAAWELAWLARNDDNRAMIESRLNDFELVLIYEIEETQRRAAQSSASRRDKVVITEYLDDAGIAALRQLVQSLRKKMKTAHDKS